MDVSRAKTKDSDNCLEAAPDFCRALATELRESFFRWAPALAKSIRWNVLTFTGRKPVCGVSPCKKHLSIVFFRGTELPTRRAFSLRVKRTRTSAPSV